MKNIKNLSQFTLEVIGTPGEPGLTDRSMVLNKKLDLCWLEVMSSEKYFALAAIYSTTQHLVSIYQSFFCEHLLK